MIIVGKNNEADFKTIQAAVDSCRETGKTEIFIQKGIYNERVEIELDGLKLIGEDKDNTIITYDLGAYEILEDGYKLGTFRTYSVLIDCDDFTAENITFENNAGLGREVGQAIALYVDGNNMTFKNCKMLASQDTLFTGPLPPKTIELRGFAGPKEFDERVNGYHVYENCYIEGDIDFIFGSASAYFDKCEIFSRNINRDVNGYVTAPSTPEGQKYGYIFNQCKFTSDAAPKSVYLGRPWRNYAKAVFIECELGEHIKSEGFDDWNKPEAHNTLLFAEYNNYGPGSEGKRANFVTKLSVEDVETYRKDIVLAEMRDENE